MTSRGGAQRLPARKILAIEEVAVGVAHAEEQMDGTPPRVGPHETGKRADAGARADQDQGRRDR